MYAPHVLPAVREYDALYRAFGWHVPARYNIGVEVCDRWAHNEPGRTAIFAPGPIRFRQTAGGKCCWMR